ncbi:MAG: homoserine dehydrogenase [Chloroflexota bacterium]
MKEIPIIIFGAGGVGRALLQQLMEGRAEFEARNRCRFRVIAVADSASWRRDADGLDDADIEALIAAKKKRRPLGEAQENSAQLLEWARAQGVERAIVVDVTAAGDMEAVVDEALAQEYAVVLANKKPLTGPWATAQHYYDEPRLRYEATVGGGQPVIATLRYLLDTGDTIMRVEGQLSGTLSYICQRMDDGTRFSVALAAAKARGVTEPDPREDLSGRDVMRKLLILGRTAGWALEEEAIEVESLYSPSLAHLDAQEFMLASLAMDPSFRDRVNAAGAAGEVLRYLAELEGGTGSVGLKAVPVESAMANLKYVSFQTTRYAEEPLLVASNTSGVQTTASGVLGDMLDLAREVF